MTSHFLKDFPVYDFKGLSDFAVKGFERINLIIGKNMVITRERFDKLLDQGESLNLTMPIKYGDVAGDILEQVDKYTVIARARAGHTFNLRDRFIIVRMGDVIVDPCTKEILGNLEILKGEVELVSQDIFLTLKSCRYDGNSKNLLELNSPKRGDFIIVRE